MKVTIGKYAGNKYWILCLRLLLGSVFIYAGISKISHPEQFADAIYNYRILPLYLINIFAIVLPWVEVFCGALLILGVFIRGSSLLLLGMLVIFSIAVSVNIVRGLDITCGCFTPWDKASKIGFKKLIENLALLVLNLQIFVYAHPFISLESHLKKL